MSVDNPLLTFYKHHHISPVHQDIADLDRHLLRRAKLYRLLGLPPAFFNGRHILEVGPGGGYNALAPLSWGATMDFVEPNPRAQQELPTVLHAVERSRWQLYNVHIEDFQPSAPYELVLAEGFIPGINNRAPIIAKLADLVQTGGVVVVTCFDEMSIFCEILKRIVGTWLLHCQGVTEFPAKVDLLSRAFASHLKALRHASRPVEDWVTDMFLNPAVLGTLFSMEDCLTEFGPDFSLLGSSPAMFSDYSWYKDIDYNARQACIKQFRCKRHMLMLTDMEESSRVPEANAELETLLSTLRGTAATLQESPSAVLRDKCVHLLLAISQATAEIDPRIPAIISEACELLSNNSLTEAEVSQAGKLAAAFGRGQQYMSLVRDR